MSDHKTCSPFQQLLQTALNQTFALGIKVAGRFIQDQDLWIRQHGASDRQPLSLPPAQLDAPFADQRIVTLRKLLNKFGHISNLSGAANVRRGGVAPAIADIFSDGAVEQEHVLFDDPDQPAVAFQLNLPQVSAIQADFAGRGIVEAGHQIA